MKRSILLQDGLTNADHYFDKILTLFSELQSSTVEAANPTLDFLTFKESLHYLGLVFVIGETRPHWLPNARELCSWEDGNGRDQTRLIGLVYLQPSQDPNVPHVHVGELSMGLVLDQRYRGLGYARHIVSHLICLAFEDPHCHRMQAVVIDSPTKPQTLTLFVQCGFSVEGTRRRSFLGPYDHVWKDVTYLAILDTDYAMRRSLGTLITDKSLWDEMIFRHQRENEQLDKWEAQRPLKRSLSVETIIPNKILANDEDYVPGAWHDSISQAYSTDDSQEDDIRSQASFADTESQSETEEREVIHTTRQENSGPPPKKRKFTSTSSSPSTDLGHSTTLSNPFHSADDAHAGEQTALHYPPNANPLTGLVENYDGDDLEESLVSYDRDYSYLADRDWAPSSHGSSPPRTMSPTLSDSNIDSSLRFESPSDDSEDITDSISSWDSVSDFDARSDV